MCGFWGISKYNSSRGQAGAHQVHRHSITCLEQKQEAGDSHLLLTQSSKDALALFSALYVCLLVVLKTTLCVILIIESDPS